MHGRWRQPYASSAGWQSSGVWQRLCCMLRSPRTQQGWGRQQFSVVHRPLSVARHNCHKERINAVVNI